MINQLKADPKRIPEPYRDGMMRMLKKSFDSLEIDVGSRFKALWVTNALDGSEDYLVSERIITLVGNKMKTFRNDLMKKKSPKSLKDLMKLITPPKGIRKKNLNTVDSRLFEPALVRTSRLFEPFFIFRGYTLTSSTKNPLVIRTFSCLNFR